MILGIKVNSFVDVITNSSSELFICNTDKTVETVRDILKNLLEDFNQSNMYSYTFEECFGSIAVVDGVNNTGEPYIDDLPYNFDAALDKRREQILWCICEHELDKNSDWSKKPYHEKIDAVESVVKIRMNAYKREIALSNVISEQSNLPSWWFTRISDHFKWRLVVMENLLFIQILSRC